MSMFMCLMLATSAAVSEVVTLTPSQDAYICDCKPDSTNPNGGPTHIYFGRYSSCYDRTLIEWDLSSIPSGSTVESAIVRLYCLGFYGTPTGHPDFYLIDEAWSEADVTFNTQPDYGTTPTIAATWPTAHTWFELDVTAFVQGWIEGTHPNHGIYCTSSGTTGTSVPGFWSKDSEDESLRPQLVVTFSPAALEGETWAWIKANDPE